MNGWWDQRTDSKVLYACLPWKILFLKKLLLTQFFIHVYPDTRKLPKIMQPSWKQGQAADWWKICDDIEWLLFEYHHPFEYIPLEPFDAVLPFHSIGTDQKTWRKERKSCKGKAITNVPTALETWPLSQAEGRWNNCMEWFGIKWTFCVSIFPNLIGSFDRSFVRSFTKQSTKIVIFYAPWQLRSLHLCCTERKNLCRSCYFHTIRACVRLWK